MKTYFIITCLLCLVWCNSFSQERNLDYCQIAAYGGYPDDARVAKFLFGKLHTDYADSLLKAFQEKYPRKETKTSFKLSDKHFYVTDALNFMKALGWELDTVYTANDFYFYVLKRKI